MKKWLMEEPARLYFIVRAIVMLLAAIGVYVVEPEALEGALAALAVIFGVDAATTEATRAKVYAPATAHRIADAAIATAHSNPREAGPYILDLVTSLVPAAKLPAGIAAVAPLVAQFANRALTDDLRKTLQRKVHQQLRNAGVLRGRTIPPSTSIVALLAVILLAACTPVSRTVTAGLNAAAGDSATLAWAESEEGQTVGITFEPGDAPAVGVYVDILGSELQLGEVSGASRADCIEEEEATGILCLFGLVDGSIVIQLAGQDITATASYRRSPSGRPFLELLTD